MTMASSLFTPSLLRAIRIISGFGLPTKYAFFPEAISIGAIKALTDGDIPVSTGPLISGFVPIRRAPLKTRLTASSIFSKL
jgi:hypothetical protein